MNTHNPRHPKSSRQLAEMINRYWGRTVAFVQQEALVWTDANGVRRTEVTDVIGSTLDGRGFPPGVRSLPRGAS